MLKSKAGIETETVKLPYEVSLVYNQAVHPSIRPVLLRYPVDSNMLGLSDQIVLTLIVFLKEFLGKI